MEQMKKPNVQTLTSLPFRFLKQGFFRFRKETEGRVYFAGAHPRRKKGGTFCFPVLSDGTVSRVNGEKRDPDEIVDVLRPLKLGITKLKFKDA